MKAKILAVGSVLAAGAAAQQSLWGQCGGIGWSGSSNCVPAAICTSYNDYYYQCIPGPTTSAGTTRTTTPATTTTTTTTSTRTSTTSQTTTSSITSSRTTTTSSRTTTTSSRTTTTSSRTTTTSSRTITTSSGTTANGSCPTNFVSTSGKEFRLEGKKFYFAGSNAYYIPMYGPNDFTDIDAALDAFKNSGLKVLRTWGFADFVGPQDDYVTVFQNWSTVPPVILSTQERGLPRLDRVIQGAESRGIKIILPFVNNWAEYGGIDLYVERVLGGSGNHGDFYTNTQIKNIFKNYVQTVINRYKNSPAILAWELSNEIRCAGPRLGAGSCTPAVTTAWAKEISEYIKSIDPCHLVAVGDEGFFNNPGSSDYVYNGGPGIDNYALTALASIDFGTFHMYPVPWGKSWDWGNQWIKDHAAQADALNKPMLFEEYGVTRSTGLRDTYHQQYHDTVFANNIAGDMFWQFGTTVPNWGKSYDDGYSIYPADTYQWKTFVVDWAAKMATKNI
ncbi:hypothetical protein DRE_01212 [Drechslerella stenobrocha 248]|uniref:mannan endo-1,4-beta-mannosidase n=1 Tax=Drechslerella stenobrocha 248 TaxID=1043628 RepID=W7HK52_9PEZI|nr:hypothetical protein DRE_01212 [Drechslerella stenobrocha 248]